jgi:hypothetical protein
MSPRDLPFRGDADATLSVFERLAPRPDARAVTARIDAASGTGDVVLDLHGRGGWIARVAVGRQRRAVSVESMPLTRLLADIVLRPPDIRHLDAAFQAIAAAPRGQSSLRVSLSELFAARCGTCGRSVVAEEFTWASGPDGAPRLVRKTYRCTTCRAQHGGPELRSAPTDDNDFARFTGALETEIARAASAPDLDSVRREIRDRFPVLDGREGLADDLVELQTPRQLVYLHAILQRIETDLRAPQVEAALRLALVEAILPASRLAGSQGRSASLRIAGARVKMPSQAEWRERNPWSAFEDGHRAVRAFVQGLDADPLGTVQARTSEDLLSLGEGMTTAVVRLGSPAGFRGLADDAPQVSATDLRRRIRLVLGQPPLRWSQDRLSLAYYLSAWVLGRDAAASLPLEPLFGAPIRPSWSWQSASLRRSLSAAAPLIATDAHAVLLLEDGGAEALAAAVLGGVAAGYRLVGAHLPEHGAAGSGWVELAAPGAAVLPGARTRANRALPPLPGGAGDPDFVHGRGVFAEPVRLERGPFSASEATRTVTDTVVEVLQARGEPAREDRLLGEILLGLDRTGQLRRFVSGAPEIGIDDEPAPPPPRETGHEAADAGRRRARVEGARPRDDVRSRDDVGTPTDGGGGGIDDTGAGPGSGAGPGTGGRPGPRGARGHDPLTGGAADDRDALADDARPATVARTDADGGAPDRVETLLRLIRDELQRPSNRRLAEIEPGRWWLAQPADQDACALPLSDRVEWAVFSLLATANRVSEASFRDRIASLFTGPDEPDDVLVRACLESYRAPSSTPEEIRPSEDLARRSEEHARLIVTLVDLGHRLGMKVWIGKREQSRRLDGRHLSEWLDDRELGAYLPLIGRGPTDELEQVDVIWYIRQKATFLFEVEWTAMVGETLLRRHARIPTTDQVVRFLVVAPERTELLRHKLARSPLLRRAMEDGNWHVMKWDHLRALASRDSVSLADLEPILGLDPEAERGGEQMPLFGS